MLKKLLMAIGALIAMMNFAFADVDVNKADQAALDGIKGVGLKLSKTILDERKKGGEFKDWADFQKRVHGIGDKSSEKLSQAGLTVNGQPKPGAVSAGDKKGKASASASASASQNAATGDSKGVKAKDQKNEKASASASAPK